MCTPRSHKPPLILYIILLLIEMSVNQPPAVEGRLCQLVAHGRGQQGAAHPIWCISQIHSSAVWLHQDLQVFPAAAVENVCVNTITAPAEFLIIQHDRLLLDPSAVPTQKTESSFDSTKHRRQSGGRKGSHSETRQRTELQPGQIWFSVLVAAEWVGGEWIDCCGSI